MKRTLIGLVFVLHGLAHSGVGMWAVPLGPDWFVLPVWWLAEVGFIVAGFGLLGIPWCQEIWEPVAVVAALSSILLLQRFGSVALAFGLVLDIVILVHGLRWGESALLSFGRTPANAGVAPPQRQRHRIAVVATSVLVAYVALAIPLRSWYLRWGTTGADRASVLPGDDLAPATTYRVDRAVTIRAPADSVWPWLVQLGQDRGGFYSYDRLERLIGAEIRNASRIHPEWQTRQEGDLVRAAQPNYLGGVFGAEPGWRVIDVVPRRAMVLDGWGAFVLVPRDSTTTTLYVRTRGVSVPSLAGTLMAPLGLLVFEPMHFFMERGMLLGIKARAEGTA
jgi:hypothetical protein